MWNDERIDEGVLSGSAMVRECSVKRKKRFGCQASKENGVW